MIAELGTRLMKHLPGPGDDWWYGSITSPTASGEEIDEQTALTCAAVYAAVKVLAETIACLPINVYQATENGNYPAPEHPLQPVLHDSFNPEMSSFIARESMQGHLGTWGNAYAEIERTRRGDPIALWPLVPSRMRVYRRDSDKQIWYDYRQDNGSIRSIPYRDMFHVPGFGYDGLIGYSPISLMAEPIGYNKAAERYGAELFANDLRPSGTIEHPGRLTEEAYRRLERAGKDVKGRRHRVRILEEGAKFAANGMKPEDVQMIEVRRFGIEEVARAYRVAPHLIQDLTHGTYSNIAELGEEFIRYTMLPWFQRWLQEINRRLLKPPFYAKFNVRAFLQADHEVREKFYSGMIRAGIFCPDDVLELEEMNPLPNGQGKTHFIARDLIPIELAINPPEPLAPVAPAAPAKPAPEKESQSAAEAFFRDAQRRMLRKEANAAKRWAKDPRTFLAKAEAFYIKHSKTCEEAFRPAVVAGYCPHKGDVDENVRDLVAEHIQTSREELLSAAECQPAELCERVDECVDKWEGCGHASTNTP